MKVVDSSPEANCGVEAKGGLEAEGRAKRALKSVAPSGVGTLLLEPGVDEEDASTLGLTGDSWPEDELALGMLKVKVELASAGMGSVTAPELGFAVSRWS